MAGRDATVTLGNSARTIRLSNPGNVRIGSVVQVNTAGMRLGIGASSVGDPISSVPPRYESFYLGQLFNRW